jgi:hypothetical protein
MRPAALDPAPVDPALPDPATLLHDELQARLDALVARSGAAAGAVCLFDVRERILRLAAEAGLSDEGCRLLRVIRGDATDWEPPLASLRAGQTSILHDDPRQPLPPLMDAPGPMAAVACVPLHRDGRPLGAALLVSAPPRSFTRDSLREHAGELEGIADAILRLHRGVAKVRERPSTVAAPVSLSRAMRPRRTTMEPGEGALDALRRTVAWTGRLPVVRNLVQGVVEPAARLAERIGQLERKTAGLWGDLRAIEAATRDREAGETQLRARLYAAEARCSKERERRRALEREHERSESELAESRAREARTRAELERAIARAAAEREVTLRSARVASETAEETRAERVAELEQARQEVARLQTELLAATDTARRAAGELAELRAEQQAAGELQLALRTALDEAQATERRLTARVAELEKQLHVQEEIQTAAAADRDVADAALRNRLFDAEGRLSQERQRGYLLERNFKNVSAELTEARRQERRLREELERVVASEAADRDEALRLAREAVQAAEERRAAAVAEAEAVRAKLAEARRLALETSEEIQRVRAEEKRVAEAAASAEIERLRAALEEAHERAGEARARSEELEAELTIARACGEAGTTAAAPAALIDATAALGPVSAADGEPAVRPASDASAGTMGPIVVVLDHDTSWPTGSSRRIDMEVFPPTSDVVDRIASLAPSSIVANLAAPGTLEVMLALRECGCASDFWGCLAAPGEEEVVPVGMVEPARAPLDVENVLEWIRGFASRGTRVLAGGDNVNAFISLRAALVREGMSVATAWDSRQTLDLLAIVRPQVVVLDLALPPHGAQVVLAQLGALEPLPSTFLVLSGGDPTAGFLRVLKDAGEELERVNRATCLAKFQG